MRYDVMGAVREVTSRTWPELLGVMNTQENWGGRTRPNQFRLRRGHVLPRFTIQSGVAPGTYGPNRASMRSATR